MEIPFLVKKGGQGHYPENLFYEPETETGRAALRGTPGLASFAVLAASGALRGMHLFGGDLYAVCGNRCYRVTVAGVATACSGSLDTSAGIVCMEDNGIQMMIVDGTSGYLVTGTTLTKITDPDFPTPSSLTYQDSYFIVTRAGTGEIYISGLYDGSAWDALDYATAEGKPDPALRVYSSHRELWIYGTESTEIFYNSGDVDFPFERIQGAFVEHGLGSAASVTAADNTLWWISEKGQAVRASGYTPQIVSTPEIERRIASCFGDAIGWSYTHGGHTFVCWSFPTLDVTWCFDTATSLWHKRTSWKSGSPAMGRHRANCYVQFTGKHIVGDYENATLYELDPDAYSDDGHVQRAVHVAPVIEAARQPLTHAELEIHMLAGVGLVSGQGVDPQVMLDWSDDDCHTWSNEHWASIGKIGERKTGVKFRRLGMAQKRNYRITITDPVERVIYGGFLLAD